jgi:hypothetical protein
MDNLLRKAYAPGIVSHSQHLVEKNRNKNTWRLLAHRLLNKSLDSEAEIVAAIASDLWIPMVRDTCDFLERAAVHVRKGGSSSSNAKSGLVLYQLRLESSYRQDADACWVQWNLKRRRDGTHVITMRGCVPTAPLDEPAMYARPVVPLERNLLTMGQQEAIAELIWRLLTEMDTRLLWHMKRETASGTFDLYEDLQKQPTVQTFDGFYSQVMDERAWGVGRYHVGYYEVFQMAGGTGSDDDMPVAMEVEEEEDEDTEILTIRDS